MRSFIAAICCVFSLASAPVLAAASEPSYVAQARQTYLQARRAVKAAETDLRRLRNEEARESRRAMARAGQWAEPQDLWSRKQAAEQNLGFAQQLERQSFDELNRARDAARRARVGTVPKPVPLSTPFWEF